MQKITFLFSLLGSIALVAQEGELGPKLKGVLIVDDSSKVKNNDLDQIHGIQFDGIENRKLERELSSFLTDFPLTADSVKELCEVIASHYRENEDLRMAVSVPEQNSEEGVVQLVVTPERLGELNVKDNQYTKPEALKKWVRLTTSDAINVKTLAQDIGWMNANPFHKVNVAYQPGGNPGVTDIDLIVSDQKNWKLSSGVDNTGTDPVGPIRIFAKLETNNFLFADHLLNLQATTADHYSEFQSYTLQYVAPLPWRNTIRIFGAYAETDPKRSPFPQGHRKTYQASGRYGIPQWFGSNPWIDQVSFEAGFDFKGADTNILYADPATPVEKKLAYIGQFVSSLKMQRNRGGDKLSADMDLVGSPISMLPYQSDADYNNLREGATPQYFYSRFGIAIDQKITDYWKFLVQGRAQFSLSNLLPSEQFALGGYSTVRGYAERVVNGDNAICGNLEIRTSEFPTIGLWLPKFEDQLSLLGFVDAGYAWFRTAVPGKPLQQSLLGIGPGLRYKIASYFTSRLDVGFPILEVVTKQTPEKVEKSSSGKPHIHFNAILSY